MVWPGDRVAGCGTFTEARVPEQLPDDAGVSHRPPGPWLQDTRRRPLLVVRPPDTGVIDGRACGEVVDQHIREAEVVTALDDAVARECQDAGRTAATAVVVPESRSDATWETGVRDGVPAPVDEGNPGCVSGDLREQPKDLRVAGRAVAPAIAVALNDLVTGPLSSVHLL